jgi:hypothetical protein
LQLTGDHGPQEVVEGLVDSFLREVVRIPRLLGFRPSPEAAERAAGRVFARRR